MGRCYGYCGKRSGGSGEEKWVYVCMYVCICMYVCLCCFIIIILYSAFSLSFIIFLSLRLLLFFPILTTSSLIFLPFFPPSFRLSFPPSGSSFFLSVPLLPHFPLGNILVFIQYSFTFPSLLTLYQLIFSYSSIFPPPPSSLLFSYTFFSLFLLHFLSFFLHVFLSSFYFISPPFP